MVISMKKYTITNVYARLAYNCLWTPEVQAVVEVNREYTGSAISPQGQSTGSGEAKELLDGGSRLSGVGCFRAIENVNTEIRDRLVGMDATDQRAIDRALIELDGSEYKSRLGANAVVAVSCAAAAAAASAVGLPLYRYLNNNAHIMPVPMFSIIDGGHYALGYANEIQEFNIFPTGAATMSEAIEISRDVYLELGEMLAKDYTPLAKLSSNAGGYSIPCTDAGKILAYITEAIHRCGYQDKIRIGLDCAASHWYNAEKDMYQFSGKLRTREEMLDIYKGFIKEFPIVTMEDPFDENDISGFRMATESLGIQIVGDDFFVTNPKRIKKRLPEHAANALLWKYNQVGTLSEAFDAAAIARENGYAIQSSERSGESEDPILADLSVALGCGQIKSGVCIRSERTAKYNRFLQIEAELGDTAVYAGEWFKRPSMK